MSKTTADTLTKVRRESGLCPRCGGIRDDKFISCSVCRSVLRRRREVHEAKLRSFHSDWKIPEVGDSPMEPDLEDRGLVVPTDFNPGSNEKVLIMAERYSNGFPIFHDEDEDCCKLDEKF